MASPDFVFLTPAYDVRWSSHRFYAEMQERIRRICERHGYPTRVVASLSEGRFGPGSVTLLDAAGLLALAQRGELDRLLNLSYVFIIGENVDESGSTFVGWHAVDALRDMTLGRGGVLYQVIERAWRATWQSEGIRASTRAIRGRDDALFFPIDGYEAGLLLSPRERSERDVDLLVYGSMAYPRRADFARRLFETELLTDRRIVVASNVFDLDDLLSRAKVVVHVNAVGELLHVPYAKVMKPLANERILFVESTPELERSDLRPFVSTFQAESADVFDALRETLIGYEDRQAELEAARPRDFLAQNYDFERNVVELLSL